MSRTRNDVSQFVNGYWRRFGITNGYNPINQRVDKCVDSPGYGLGDNLALTIDKYSMSGGVINQIIKDGGSYYTGYFDNYTCDACASGAFAPLILTYPGELSTAAYAAQTLARASPNHPDVDVIQNVLEIGDIPRTLKVYGETLIEKLAENYIRYKFGIQPLVRDVARVVDWSSRVNSKLEIIKRLRDTGGYRKTVRLDSLSASQYTASTAMQSNGCFLTSSVQSVGHREIRGHARYLPTADYSKYSQAEMSALAKRAFSGFEWNLSGLWEGLPWSWLIDWYTNIGDLLSQTRNVIPVTCSGVTIIRQTTTESYTQSVNDGLRVITPAHVIRQKKERYPASATFDAHLPLLDGSQMGILASLMVMKQKYRSFR
jgi:hypothetical protein